MPNKTNNHHLNPLAYFITFTCYGTWLPGSKKSFVDRNHNDYATPYLSNKPAREQGAKEAMQETPFLLNTENRRLILNTIKEVCVYRQWNLFATHVRTNHIHCVINADVTPEKVMDVIKAYASRALNKKGCHRKKYWTRHGSTKYLWRSQDMVLTIRYVLFEQGEPMAVYDSEQYELNDNKLIFYQSRAIGAARQQADYKTENPMPKKTSNHHLNPLAYFINRLLTRAALIKSPPPNNRMAVIVRRRLIAGNWKMHGSQSQVQTLIDGIKQEAGAYSDIDIAVLPTFVHLAQVHALLKNSPVMLGAQNLYIGAQGAFTGEVSGAMLKDLGCRFVLIGHSERRSIFQEDLALTAAKFKAAQEAGLTPILCVGESQAQREKGETEQVVGEQIESIIKAAGITSFAQAVIAYEPVWAIGTGLTATPEQAQAVHAFIRTLLAQNNVDIARTIRILYGGSMKPDNAASLLAMPDIDGGLIGGASLDAGSFLKICAAAHTSKATV